jgi:hypothetical protein
VPDILAMLISERNKLNRAIEALGGEIGHAIIRATKAAPADPGPGPVGPVPGPGRTRRLRRRRSGPKPGQHFHTDESRARIAAAQRARWAKSTVRPTFGKVPGMKFKQSAAAKAKISMAMKARWAEKKKRSK